MTISYAAPIVIRLGHYIARGAKSQKSITMNETLHRASFPALIKSLSHYSFVIIIGTVLLYLLIHYPIGLQVFLSQGPGSNVFKC